MTTLVDAPKILCDFLANDAGFTAVVADRIYADADYPPPDYQPVNGGAVCVKARAAALPFSTQENNGIHLVSFQFRCYGNERAGAAETYRALFAALDNQGGSLVRFSYMEGTGRPLIDPRSQWPVIIVFFMAFIANS